MDKYIVAEIIGGWAQEPKFIGTLEECQKFLSECSGNEFIESADTYEVNYL